LLPREKKTPFNTNWGNFQPSRKTKLLENQSKTIRLHHSLRQKENINDGPHGRPNLKDPLQVSDGPVTRSKAKKIKEAMQGLMQSAWVEFANLSSKTPTFNMGLKEDEPALMHVIQAT
jgi:hypothetical protein